MPYLLGGSITSQLKGLWGEGAPYQREVIYNLESDDPSTPPVNYSTHIIKPHSIPHVDVPRHIIRDGATVDHYFKHNLAPFFGSVVVVRLTGEFKAEENQALTVYRFSAAELQERLLAVTGSEAIPEKLFVTAAKARFDIGGQHDPSQILVPSIEAANFLVSNPKFNAYGTSWKSSDYEPGSRERPVHKILLKQALLFECLKMDHIPEGIYFLSAFPLPLEGASESPLMPVLFDRKELS